MLNILLTKNNNNENNTKYAYSNIIQSKPSVHFPPKLRVSSKPTPPSYNNFSNVNNNTSTPFTLQNTNSRTRNTYNFLNNTNTISSKPYIGLVDSPFKKKTNYMFLTNNFIEGTKLRSNTNKRMSVGSSVFHTKLKIPIYRSKDGKKPLLKTVKLNSGHNSINSNLLDKSEKSTQKSNNDNISLPGLHNNSNNLRSEIRSKTQILENQSDNKEYLIQENSNFTDNNNKNKDKDSLLNKKNTKINYVKGKNLNLNLLKKTTIADIKRLTKPTISSTQKTSKE